MTAKTSFISRVMAKLTGGDEAKIARFQAKAVKFYNTQINIRKNEVDDLKEKKADLQEAFDESVITVDVDKIKTTEGVDSYIQDYTRKLNAGLKAIKAVDAEVKVKEAEIADFKALIEVLG